MKKSLFCAAAVLLCSLYLVGCGSSGKSEVNDNSSGGSGTPYGDPDGDPEDGPTNDGTEQNTFTELQFDISDAVAIMKSNNTHPHIKDDTGLNTNLLKLTNAGGIEQVFAGPEDIAVSNYFISPNGKLLVLLDNALEIDGLKCKFYMLSKDGAHDCIDSEVESITLNYDICRFRNDNIQFDALGDLYYYGKIGTYDHFTDVLRVYSIQDKTSHNLINDNVNLEYFTVRDDGSVFLIGSSSNGSSFFRSIKADGSVNTVSNSMNVFSMFEMPNGKIYIGAYDGVWAGTWEMEDDGSLAKFYKDEDVHDLPFKIYDHYRAPDDKFYIISGCGYGRRIWKFWPGDIYQLETSVEQPLLVKGFLSNLLISGYDPSNDNKFIAHNIADGSETDLLNGKDIEIYHFNYSSSTNLIYFDGLRFDDNTYIVGTIDLENGNELTVLESGIQYDDVQFF